MRMFLGCLVLVTGILFVSVLTSHPVEAQSSHTTWYLDSPVCELRYWDKKGEFHQFFFDPPTEVSVRYNAKTQTYDRVEFVYQGDLIRDKITLVQDVTCDVIVPIP